MLKTRSGAAALVAAALIGTALMQAGCTGSGIPAPTGIATETTETSVFYSTGRTLIEEKRLVDAKDAYLATLTTLLKAQPDQNDVAIVQPEANVLSVEVKNGIATVDWAKEVLSFDATDKEKSLAWASILMTLSQFPEVKEIKFTVEGKDSGKIGDKDVQTFWGRVSLKGQPWKAMRPPNWVDPSKPATSSTGATGTK